MPKSISKKEYGLEKEQAFLSNERTLLSYIRTSLAAFLFGLAFLKFSTKPFDYLVSFSSIAIGFIFVIIGILSFNNRKRKILVGYYEED